MDPFEERAAQLVQQQATVHERHACPKCAAAVGERCRRVRSTGEGRLWLGEPLRHSHAERIKLEVPLR